MKLTVAESAGFCFGVNKAVNTVSELLSQGKKVCTLGSIIHNPQIIDKFKNLGVITVNSPSEVPKGYVLVIRSHGTTPDILSEAENRNIKYFDATCPFVSKIHKIVKDYSFKGCNILVAGDENHPEVKGIIGCCLTEALTFASAEDLRVLIEKREDFFQKGICLVSQTTFNTEEWKKSLKIIKNLCTKTQIFDTICNATYKRQKEAELLSKQSDFMVVIGGKQSSNTAKLYDVCSQYCDTVLVESPSEIPLKKIKNANSIGITAGASTPSYIIKEAVNLMSENVNEKEIFEVSEDEQNFEQMLEESLKNFNMDEKVHGVVVGITPTEVYVDVGRKQAGFIPANELSYDPVRPEDVLKVGDELDLLIMKTNDQEGTIMLSKKRLDSMKAWDELMDANKEDKELTGKVKEAIKGGLIVEASGLRVFVPASLSSLSRRTNLDEMVGKEVTFKIIEVNRRRRRCVGSIRACLEAKRKELEKEFWQGVEIGKVYHGQVKSLERYGAFVSLGVIDGMIHISELSWTRIKHPSDVVNVGDNVEVYVKDFDEEKGRISLGYKKQEDNPWVKLEREFSVGDVIEVEITGMAPFGVFARIIPEIDGLIHISQISDRRIDKPQDVLSVGQKVQAKIMDIDATNKRVSLSMRALFEQPEESSVAMEEKVESEEVSTEE